MPILDFYGLKKDINKVISEDIRLPNIAAILKKEKIKVCAYVDNQEEEAIAQANPEEPLNIRFRMDPTEQKRPTFMKKNLNESIFNSFRCLEIGSQIVNLNGIQLNLGLTLEYDEILYGCFEKNFKKNKQYPGGWSSLFTHNEKEQDKKFWMPKSNSIVINDNYIFNQISRKRNNLGLLNLTKIFEVIMPETSSDEFHITIITSAANWMPDDAKRNFESISSALENKFKYPIFIELVIWGRSLTENHKRMLISNYFIATTDKGFDLFNEDNSAYDTNDILIRRIFHDVRQPGESPYQQSLVRLELLSKIYNEAKAYCLRVTQTKGMIYLSNNIDKNKSNRLL